jgi:hypothetical protein
MMTKRRPFILIGTPAIGGQLSSLYTSSVLQFQNACLQGGGIDFNVLVPGVDSLITRARQDIVARFLEVPDATHLLFVDADIGFEPDQVFRLLRFDSEIAAAPYPHQPAGPALAGHPQPESAFFSYAYAGKDPGQAVLKNSFMKVPSAGTGFMLVKRSVFLDMIKCYPGLNYSSAVLMDDPLSQSPFRYAFFNCLLDEKTGMYLGEDASFCRRWTDIGGEIWADMDSRLEQVGRAHFRGDFGSPFPKITL